MNCTACPSGYKHNPTLNQPRRCTLLSTSSVNNQLLTIQEYGSSYTSDIDYLDDEDNAISSLDGIHCGEDSGLGSIWEANLRMPALIRWDGKIKPGSVTNATVSTLDVVPTILSILDETIYNNDNDKNHKRSDNVNCSMEDKHDGHSGMHYKHERNGNSIHDLQLDGIDISHVLFHPIHSNNHNNNVLNSSCNNTTNHSTTTKSIDRLLFFWRDGFDDGPLGPPYGRYDVVAVKVIQEQYHYHHDDDNDNIIVYGGPYNYYKLWFYTKSAHLNNDSHMYHDPPLMFQIDIDPAEEYPIEIDMNDIQLQKLIKIVKIAIEDHKKSITWTYPLTIERDPMSIPCVNRESKCRTPTITSTATITTASDEMVSSIK